MNDKKRSAANTKTPERGPSLGQTRPATRGRPSGRPLVPFYRAVLPERSRGAATSAPPPPHRPDLLAGPHRVKQRRRPRKRTRCRRQRWTRTDSRAGSPARGGTSVAASHGRPDADKVGRRRQGMLMHSGRIPDINPRATESVRNDVHSIRNAGLSQSAISLEFPAADTAAIAMAAEGGSAHYAAKQAAIATNNGPAETHAAANNAGNDSQRQQPMTAATGAHICSPNTPSPTAGQSVAGSSSAERQPSSAPGREDRRPLVCSGTQTETGAGRTRLCAACQKGQ